MKDQIDSNFDVNTKNSPQTIRKSPRANNAKKFSIMLLKSSPQTHVAYNKMKDFSFNPMSAIKENDRSSTPDFNKDVRPALRYSMAKSSERFAFNNRAEFIDLKGSFKHYVGKVEEKANWNSLINKTNKEVKFSSLKRKSSRANIDQIGDLVKEKSQGVLSRCITPQRTFDSNPNYKHDISHSSIGDFLKHLPKYSPKISKRYKNISTDILNVKKNYEDIKRSKSTANLQNLQRKGYAGVSTYVEKSNENIISHKLINTSVVNPDLKKMIEENSSNQVGKSKILNPSDTNPLKRTFKPLRQDPNIKRDKIVTKKLRTVEIEDEVDSSKYRNLKSTNKSPAKTNTSPLSRSNNYVGSMNSLILG